ncbi:MAG: DGQHR domain-containing protein [Prevotella sp.]|nr:DGQHR domain-containing protein [Prevotella sp.]
MKIYKYLEVNQPIGTFYITSIKAGELINFVKVISRSESNDGVQRDLNPKRVKEIADYCIDTDSTFPTSIIISVTDQEHFRITNEQIEIDEEFYIGNVIDGQHRLAGIIESKKESVFELPVVFMYNLTIEEQAYVFSIINSKQTKVNPSLIYDLFGIAIERSPQKISHEIARALNQNPSSPFYMRLKMLGRKEPDQNMATISQGTFVDFLLKMIYIPRESQYKRFKVSTELNHIDNMPFRELYIEKQDATILKIIFNCFNALKTTFETEWKSTDYILWKTTGFCGVMRSLPILVRNGLKQKDLSENYFNKCFNAFKSELENSQEQLTSNYFGSGDREQTKFANLILKANKLGSVNNPNI